MHNIVAFPRPKTCNKEQYTRLSYQILHQTYGPHIAPTHGVYDVWSTPDIAAKMTTPGQTQEKSNHQQEMTQYIQQFAHNVHATPSNALIHALSKYGTTIHDIIELLWISHPANTEKNNPYINDTHPPSIAPDQHYKE